MSKNFTKNFFHRSIRLEENINPMSSLETDGFNIYNLFIH